MIRARHPELGNPQPLAGKNCYIKPSADIDTTGQLIMGNNVWILDQAMIITHKHNAENPDPVANSLLIGSDVTIYARAIITPNCHRIGKNSRIAAGAVVFDNVAPHSLMVGNPAVKVKDLSKKRLDFL